jgi:phage terminase large subunit
MVLDFKKNKDKLFNQSFFEIRKAKTPYVVVYGGSGSGKSRSVMQNELLQICTARYDTLYIRKNASDLYESCYKEAKTIAENWKIYELFRWVYSSQKREVISHYSKKKIVFRGIDDPGKLKSIVGFKRVIIEEADQLTFEDFTELTRRVRGIKDIQIYLVFNPIDEKHWIKEHIFDKVVYSKNATFFRYLYKDNKFLTADDIDRLEALREVNPYEYQVYVLGEWGVILPGSPYYYNFRYDRHVKKGLEWNKNLPVVLSFDFNVVNSCLAGQVSLNDKYVRFIKEWHQKGLDLQDLIDEIVGFFGEDAEYIITGDSSGNNKSSTTEDNASGYDIIEKRFNYHGIYRGDGLMFRVPNSNVRLKNGKRICNAIFKNEEDLFFDDGLRETIGDVQRMKLSADGSLDKKDANKKNYGHLGDCVRYFICNLCMELYNNYKVWRKKGIEYEGMEEDFDEFEVVY